jgi:hypothetical protein
LGREHPLMADVPDNLVLKRHRDLEGLYRRGIYVRRAILSTVLGFCLLGLANVFGQATSTSEAAFGAGTLSVSSATALRGGDLTPAVFTIHAVRDVKNAILVLDPGWATGMSINTIEPSPTSETSDKGRLAFTLGPISAGDSFTLFMQFQVNPTNVTWQRPQDVQLRDGAAVLATIHRTLTVYP